MKTTLLGRSSYDFLVFVNKLSRHLGHYPKTRDGRNSFPLTLFWGVAYHCFQSDDNGTERRLRQLKKDGWLETNEDNVILPTLERLDKASRVGEGTVCYTDEHLIRIAAYIRAGYKFLSMVHFESPTAVSTNIRREPETERTRMLVPPSTFLGRTWHRPFEELRSVQFYTERKKVRDKTTPVPSPYTQKTTQGR